MARLLRREGKFFDFFNEHADLAILAAAELKLLLEDIGDLELRRRNIERYEKQADHITHQTIALLHKTFITPLDRDEIHQLITGMDDILDLIEEIAQCLFLYDVRAVTGEARRLAGGIVLMHRGRVLESSPADEFFATPKTAEARRFINGELLV